MTVAELIDDLMDHKQDAEVRIELWAPGSHGGRTGGADPDYLTTHGKYVIIAATNYEGNR